MRFRHLRRWAVLGVAAMVSALGASTVRAVTLSAGQVPSPAQVTDRDLVVPRFEIVTPSPYEISGDARPGQFFGVMSDRAAWLGLETGEAEVWIHPLKIASRLELSFSAPRFGSIPGRDIARTVVTRPGLSTIHYNHSAFRVRQHIVARDGLPGLLILLEVDTTEPIQVMASFEPVLDYMWPGSLGGQYSYWSEDDRAFVISESLQERNAIVGSPFAENSLEHPAHQLGEAIRSMAIHVDPGRARSEVFPIAIAGGQMPRDSALAAYRDLIAGVGAELAAQEGTRVLKPRLGPQDRSREEGQPLSVYRDADFRRALAWARANIEDQYVCNPDLGCGLVAGWGRSGSGARPGFGWFFGGDAAITTLAMDVTGQWSKAAEAISFLARHQREDGKIPHEVSQSAAHIPWFETYPYAYYHADTTPHWMYALHHYWRATADDELVEALWPAYRKAWEWCLSAETDGDGIIENTVGGLAAVEVGDLGAAVHQDVYLAGVWVAALEGTLELAARMGDAAMLTQARDLAPVARATLNEPTGTTRPRTTGSRSSPMAGPTTTLLFGPPPRPPSDYSRRTARDRP